MPHIAIVTAGGAGMYCGSCMHDNTWARSLIRAGAEVTLVPTYTPIRVDEPNLSESEVYLGGLNVYLRSRWRWWRRLPDWSTRWLDRPGLIRWATRFSVSNEAAELGQLTLDMLAGAEGPQRDGYRRLAQHLARELRPDAIIFSNALLAGALPALRSVYSGPVFGTLQGDDVFLDSLPEGIRRRAIDAVGTLSHGFDGFLVHSQFYRDYMAEYLQLDRRRFQLLPLSIDPEGHDGQPGERIGQPFTVGYFARMAPEKGLHHLVDAFAQLHSRLPTAQLRIGGYLGPQQEDYYRQQCSRLSQLGDVWNAAGSPVSHAEKVEFYRSVDVLSVPTEFQEPKGLYVLEALANGVPVVQPAHGAFPELIQSTGGGLLVPPRDPQALADAWLQLARDRERRVQLGTVGQQAVHTRFSLQRLAEETLRIVAAPTDG
ncbi:MAG: glycosyltransferase family 4 protein [Planctomycetaceae bacterium]